MIGVLPPPRHDDAIMRAVILKGTGEFLERLRAQAVAALTTPEAYAARFARKRERAEAERAVGERALPTAGRADEARFSRSPAPG